MPNYRVIAVQAAKRNGVDPKIFLRQIQQESGFNPNARSSAGAVGIAQIVPHWHPGVDATDPVASLNYAAHLMGTLVKKYGDYQQALSVYNSGKPDAYRDPSFSGGQTFNYVNRIMAGAKPPAPVAAVAPAPVAAPALAAPAPAAPSGVLGLLRQSLAQGDRMVGLAPLNLPVLPTPRAPAFIRAPAAAPAPLSPGALLAPGKFRAGSPVLNLTGEGGLHDTAGLAGYPAHDYFAPSGSRVVAPITGRVVKVSGHPPSEGPIDGPHGPLGWSVYIQAADGQTYYLTHMGSRNVRVGETLRAGQVIGTVADYAKYGTPSHIHMGVSGG